MPNDSLSPEEWARLARHLAGEDADADATRRWLAEDPRRAQESDEARSTWHAMAPAVDAAAARRAAASADTDDAWARLSARVSESPRPTMTVTRVDRRRLTMLGAGLAAAAAIVVAVARSRDTAPTWTTYATPAGQRATVYLPDGSRADLRASTTLRVSVDARRGARTVQLTGEAVFTVKHDTKRPFRVYARGAVAEDVGTVFAVRAYPTDSVVRVIVAEGAVAVGSRRTALAPGDIAAVDATGGVAVTHTEDPHAYLAWTGDRLVFRAERVDAVIADLARTYDARIVLRDPSLATRRITLDMPTGSLSSATETLGALLGVSVSQRGDTLVLGAP